MSAANELLLPRTDAGVGAQILVTIALTVAIVVLVRRERSLVLVTVGAATVVLGLMGLRALH